MKKLLIAITFFFTLSCQVKTESRIIPDDRKIGNLPDSIPPMAKTLMVFYKDYISGFSNNFLIFKDGSKLEWDDGKKNKSFEEILNRPDLKDMFSQNYPAGVQKALSLQNNDPGRIRNDTFFRKIYGNTEKEVKNNLTEITWCPDLIKQKIKVTTINGVDKKLLLVSKELDKHPEIKKYILNIGGTFNWRLISGTTRQSLHSYGMTIDINTTYSNYWQWDCKCKKENTTLNYKNKIPQLIIDIFEKNGFIWGGKWYHYDTMHFEYRPELL